MILRFLTGISLSLVLAACASPGTRDSTSRDDTRDAGLSRSGVEVYGEIDVGASHERKSY